MQAAANTAATLQPSAACGTAESLEAAAAAARDSVYSRPQLLQRAVVRCSSRRGGSSCLLKSWTNFENATFDDQTIVCFVLNFNQFIIWLRVFFSEMRQVTAPLNATRRVAASACGNPLPQTTAASCNFI